MYLSKLYIRFAAQIQQISENKKCVLYEFFSDYKKNVNSHNFTDNTLSA